MKIACPHCEGRIDADSEWLGQTANCPHCDNAFEIKAELKVAMANPADPQERPGVAKVILFTGVACVVVAIIIAASFALQGGTGSGTITLKKAENGLWDFRALRHRSEPEQEYLKQLVKVQDSLLSMRWVWRDVERANSFPGGEFWKGKDASRAQGELRRIQMSVGHFNRYAQEMVSNFNLLQTRSELLLVERPELEKFHQRLKLKTGINYKIGDPMVGYELKTLQESVDKMFEELRVIVPTPKI